MDKIFFNKMMVGVIIYTFISVMVSLLFFDSLYACIIFIILFPFYVRKLLEQINDKNKHELRIEFCEMIGSLSASLSSGMSVENAVITSCTDMERLYSENAVIVKELRKIIEKIRMNVSVNTAIMEFADRTKVDDIVNFSTVFNEAVFTGGNLSEIINDTVIVMQDKRRTEDEIEALLKGKMLEQKVICLIPFLIILFLRFTSNEFINVLYHNVAGILVMTICLVLYILSILMSERIIKIDV